MWLSAWIMIAAGGMAFLGLLLFGLSGRMMNDSSNFVPGFFGYILSLSLFAVSALTLCVGVVWGIVEWYLQWTG